jgi:HSP20 family protein
MKDGRGGPWSPQVNIYERKDALIIKLELAGLTSTDVEIKRCDGLLTVEGSRLDADAQKRDLEVGGNIPFGSFLWTYSIPSGYDSSNASAFYQNGFLRITIPRQGGGHFAEAAHAQTAVPGIATTEPVLVTVEA